ncbi:MAG TPA: methionine biosynthesis protein MetW [Opitutales bacterium]|nr:methionine biosynthesis protein MetW [Opitutales bacterium]
MQSPIYWHPKLYAAAMRMLYGEHFAARYEDIAKLIPEGSRVVDVCMGDGRLYRDYLQAKGVDYLGLDINESFVRHAQKHGVPARVFDMNADPLPPADFVVMQGSLYHFIPNEREILEKLLAAARKTLIISEPIKNLSSSPNRLVAWVARKASTTKGGKAEKRFHYKSLRTLFANYGELREILPVAGERELAGIFETAA